MECGNCILKFFVTSIEYLQKYMPLLDKIIWKSSPESLQIALVIGTVWTIHIFSSVSKIIRTNPIGYEYIFTATVTGTLNIKSVYPELTWSMTNSADPVLAAHDRGYMIRICTICCCVSSNVSSACRY